LWLQVAALALALLFAMTTWRYVPSIGQLLRAAGYFREI
jgi:hypothetical protein